MTKILIGSGFSTFGMLCLFIAASSAPAGGKIGLTWPVLFHVINSIGFGFFRLYLSRHLLVREAKPAPV